MKHPFILSLACLTFAALSGCGPKGPAQHEHWGKVTFQGKPIPAGLIYFDPDLQAGNDGPQGQALIKDGVYDTRLREKTGPGSGKYVIRVQANDGIAAPEAPIGRSMFANQIQIKVDLPAADSELDVVIPPESK